MPRRKPENRYVEVILLEADKHLGEKYDVVKVKPIFAKNVLLPKNIAVLSTPATMNDYKYKILHAQKEKEKRVASLQEFFDRLIKDGGLVVERNVNEKNSLYDKVDSNDISTVIKELYSIDIDAHYFRLKKKITEIGEYRVPFKYKDMEKDIQVIVKAKKVAPDSKKEEKKD